MLAFFLAASVAHAQCYPSKPVRIINPFAPGAATDILARYMAQQVSSIWGQPMVVENKPGASGAIGVEWVAKSPPDGYTLLIATQTTHAANPALYAKLPYDVVDLMFDNLPTALPQIKEGKIRGLAVTTASRSSLAPELPTMAESGLPGFEISTWFAFFAPAATPRDIVSKCAADMRRVLVQPDARDRLTAIGVDARASTPEELAAFSPAELAKKIVQESGARLD